MNPRVNIVRLPYGENPDIDPEKERFGKMIALSNSPLVETAPTVTGQGPVFSAANSVLNSIARTDPHVSRRLLVETIGTDSHFVFNPLSGAVDVLDDAELAYLMQRQNGKPVEILPDLDRHFWERRYFFDSACLEEEYLETAVSEAWARMQARQPETYTVCPTLACNLACAYCFEGDSLTDKPQGVMTQSQVAQLFQAIAQIRHSTKHSSDYPPWIALFGGEPLLPSTKNCVAEIMRLASQSGFLVSATTNGVNVARYESLLREYQDILATFQITLDGPQAIHDSRRHRLGGQGTFREIVQGIDLLLSLDIDVDLRVNLDAANLPSLPELADFIFEKGWHCRDGFQLALAPVTQHGAGGCSSKQERSLSEMELVQGVLELSESYPRLGQLCHLGFLRHLDYLVYLLEPDKRNKNRNKAGRIGPRYWYCEASTDKQFVFTPEGLIYSCTEAVGKPAHAIGRFDPELTLWQAEAKQWIGRTILSHPKCRTCSISTLCGGGCNFAAREQQAGKEKTMSGDTPSSDRLIQVLVKSKMTAPRVIDENEHPPKAAIVSNAFSPYCNAAEQTVRAYLQHIGQRWMEC